MAKRVSLESADQVLSLFKKALAFSASDQLEIVLEGEQLALTRLAESKISQNLTTADTLLTIRAVKDKKIGVAQTNALELDALKATIRSAEEISGVQKKDDAFVGLPQSPEAQKVASVFESTEEAGAPVLTEALVQPVGTIGAAGMQVAGAFKTTLNTVAVANSLGTEQFFRGTSTELSVTVTGAQKNSGFAIGYSRDYARIEPARLLERAAAKARMSLNPVSIPSGDYAVILEPAALGQLLILLSFLGFGCKTYVSGRSYMSGKLGQKILGDNITVTEDPYNDLIRGMPFDYEGVPTQPVKLIENGIARGVVWNSYFANQSNEKSTGHAQQAYKTFTPYPKSLVMEGGSASVEEMISSTEDGIYITHFWYVNYLNPMKTQVTGTTLDGTFLIENGKITKPIVNLRMKQSILDALSNCSLLSSVREIYPQYSVVMLLPYAKIEKFHLEAEEG